MKLNTVATIANVAAIIDEAGIETRHNVITKVQIGVLGSEDADARRGTGLSASATPSSDHPNSIAANMPFRVCNRRTEKG